MWLAAGAVCTLMAQKLSPPCVVSYMTNLYRLISFRSLEAMNQSTFNLLCISVQRHETPCDPFHWVTGFVLRFPRVPLYIIRTFYWRVTVFSEVTSFRVADGYHPFGVNWYFYLQGRSMFVIARCDCSCASLTLRSEWSEWTKSFPWPLVWSA